MMFSLKTRKITTTPICLAIFLVLLNSFSLAQDENLAEDQKPKFAFNADLTRFRYSDSLTFLEFSASFYRNFLYYVPEGGQFKGEFIVTSDIMEGDSLVARKSWKNINMVDSLAVIQENHRLYCVNNFVLENKDYQMKIQIKDTNNPETKASYDFKLEVPGFSDTTLLISDIQLGSSIERDTSRSVYVKNGFRVFPNPSGLYGLGLPILYTYSEIYNLVEATSDSGAYYLVNYKILNADGVEVKDMGSKRRKKPGSSAVEVNGLNVVTLVSGTYYVVLISEDLETNQKATSARKFFVYREGDFAEGSTSFTNKQEVKLTGSPGLDAAKYDVMSEKEIDKEFEYARYIAAKEERDTFKKLNPEGKRKYIQEFWANRDQTPGSPANEFKQDYLARVEYSNNSFRGTFREGWRTDRGRVLLVYGRPDEIERFPFSNENRSYEIWHFFSIQGGVIFIFVDKRDMGDLELVNSTARGELYDPEWQRWIDPNR